MLALDILKQLKAINDPTTTFVYDLRSDLFEDKWAPMYMKPHPLFGTPLVYCWETRIPWSVSDWIEVLQECPIEARVIRNECTLRRSYKGGCPYYEPELTQRLTSSKTKGVFIS